MRPITGRSAKNRSVKRKSGPLAAGLDPVRILRICGVLERTVMAGFRPPDHPAAVSFAGPQTSMSPRIAGSRGSAGEVLSRQLAIYLAHVGCGFTYTQAARLYGRDRSTAAHACKVVEDRRDDPRIDRILELLEGCARLGLAQIEPDLAALRGRS